MRWALWIFCLAAVSQTDAVHAQAFRPEMGRPPAANRPALMSRPAEANRPAVMRPNTLVGVDLSSSRIGVGQPSGRKVVPERPSRRGTLFGSIYRDDEPLNPNQVRHPSPSRSRRKAIQW